MSSSHISPWNTRAEMTIVKYLVHLWQDDKYLLTMEHLCQDD